MGNRVTQLHAWRQDYVDLADAGDDFRAPAFESVLEQRTRQGVNENRLKQIAHPTAAVGLVLLAAGKQVSAYLGRHAQAQLQLVLLTLFYGLRADLLNGPRRTYGGSRQKSRQSRSRT